jgi:hypothetical protein
MASTGTILLPVQGAKLPTADAALIDGGETNWRLLFPDSTDYSCVWQFRMPHDFATGLKAHLHYSMASGTSGRLIMGVEVMAITPGDAADVNTESYASVNTGTQTAPINVGFVSALSFAITANDNLVANDFVKFRLSRDADNANDTVTGYAEILNFTLEYLTT